MSFRSCLLLGALAIATASCAGASPEPAAAVQPVPARVLVQRGPAGFVSEIAISPAGTRPRVAVVSFDGSVSIYDLETRALLERFGIGLSLSDPQMLPAIAWVRPNEIWLSNTSGGVALDVHGGRLGAVPFGLSQMKPVATGLTVAKGIDGLLWFTEDGVWPQELKVPPATNAANFASGMEKYAVSKSGNLIAWVPSSISADRIFLSRKLAPSMQELEVGFGVDAIEFSSDSELLLGGVGPLGGSFSSALYRLDIGTKDAEAVPIENINGDIRDIEVGAGGQIAVAANELVLFDKERQIRWRVGAAELGAQATATRDGFQHVRFAGNDKYLVAATFSAVHVFDTESGRYIGTMGEPLLDWAGLAFVDEDNLAVWGAPGIAIWDIPGARIVARRKIEGLSAIKPSATGWRLVHAGESDIRAQLDLTLGHLDGSTAVDAAELTWSGRPVRLASRLAEPQEGRVDFAADGDALVYERVADERERRELVLIRSGGERVLDGSLDAEQPEVSPRGQYVAARLQPHCDRGEPALWASSTAKRVTLEGVSTAIGKQMGFDINVDPLSFSADESRLGFLRYDGATIWRTADGRRVVDIAGAATRQDPLVALAFAASSASTWAAVTQRGSVQFYEDAKLQQAAEPTGSVPSAIALSPSGRLAAVLGVDGEIQLVNRNTGKRWASLMSFAGGEDLLLDGAGRISGTPGAIDLLRVGFAGSETLHPGAEFRAELTRDSASNAPPSLRIAPPPSVTAKLTSRVGSTVTLMVAASPNARVRVVGEGVEVASGEARPTVDVSFELLPNVKQYDAIAFDERGHASPPTPITIESPPTAANRLWIVSAGVRDYATLKGFEKLAFADTDACSVAHAFSHHYKDVRSRTLVNKAASPTAIVQSLDELTEMRPTDLAVVFLSGHAVRDRDGSTVFLTSESRVEAPSPGAEVKGGLRWSQVAASIGRARGRVIIMLDMCHSGAFSTAPSVSSADLAGQLTAAQRSGVVVLSSSKGFQSSLELLTDDPADAPLTTCPAKMPRVRGGGLFRLAIEEVLANPAPRDRNGDGILRVSEFVDAVSFRVSKRSNGAQVPSVSRREAFSDFGLLSVP